MVVHMRRARAAQVLVVLLCTGACTTSHSKAAPAEVPSASPSSSPVSQSFEATLRDRLDVGALPSFTLPTDVLSSEQDRRVLQQLNLEPGLYRGIAVLDARCDADGIPHPIDGGQPPVGNGAGGTYKDGVRNITVAADGTGVYDAPELHVAVLPGGAGVYSDKTVRLTVQADGAGTYTDGARRLTVRADRSGSYEDKEMRLWVGPDGAGGYDDSTTHVSLSASGVVSSRGGQDKIDAIRAVLKDRLPGFPAVPRLARIQSAGTSCGTVVRLDSNVLFDFGDASVRPSADDLLQRVATLLKALGSPSTAVNGYTDGIGSDTANLDLSQRRARAVRDTLVDLGVPPGSLTADGLGETHPVRAEVHPDGTDDPAGRQLNRRVELVLRAT